MRHLLYSACAASFALSLAGCPSGGGNYTPHHDGAVDNLPDGGGSEDLKTQNHPSDMTFKEPQPDFSPPPPSCSDGIKNGDETDVDCGGSCPQCPDLRSCLSNNDCVNFNCSNDLCCPGARGNCDGNRQNGCEVDLTSDPFNCGGCGNACPNGEQCQLGNCVAAQPKLVGSFTPSQGPPWANNPPTYTCQEACALVFGGTANQYSCSTSNNAIDHMAFVDGWGDQTHCSANPVSESYKLNTNYNCGAMSCAFSAYVMDHGCMTPNYCYK